MQAALRLTKPDTCQEYLYVDNRLQYSCLENPMDRGAWLAAVHGVAKSWTRLSDFTFTFFPLPSLGCLGTWLRVQHPVTPDFKLCRGLWREFPQQAEDECPFLGGAHTQGGGVLRGVPALPSVFQAGLASPENSEQLIIALEPEAASIYCRKLRLHQMTDLSSKAAVNGHSPSDSVGAGFAQGTCSLSPLPAVPSSAPCMFLCLRVCKGRQEPSRCQETSRCFWRRLELSTSVLSSPLPQPGPSKDTVNSAVVTLVHHPP